MKYILRVVSTRVDSGATEENKYKITWKVVQSKMGATKSFTSLKTRNSNWKGRTFEYKAELYLLPKIGWGEIELKLVEDWQA